MKFVIVSLGAGNKETDNLKKLRISQYNPRFTVLTNLTGEDLIRNITKSDQEQSQIAQHLFKLEGNLKDLVDLTNSIRGGFDSSEEKIILVQDEGKNYYVAEGNRRIMILKILNQELVLPELSTWNKSDHYENLTNDDEESNEKLIKQREKNYSKLKNLLDSARQQFQNKPIKISVRVEQNPSQILKAIFTKHVAGNRPGMRNWSRGKYFTDILSIFKSGIPDSERSNQEIRSKLRREPSLLIDDYKHAQFVRAVLEVGLSKNHQKQTTENEVSQTMQLRKISALQHNFSLKRIRDAALQILDIDKKEFKEYFDFKFDRNKGQTIQFLENKKVFYRNVLWFIYDWWNKGVITTRPIVEIADQKRFNNAVLRLLTGHPDQKVSEKTDEELREEDGFTLEPEVLQGDLQKG